MEPWETEMPFHPVKVLPAMQRVTANLIDAWCDCGMGSGAPSTRHTVGCRYRQMMQDVQDELARGDYPPDESA